VFVVAEETLTVLLLVPLPVKLAVRLLIMAEMFVPFESHDQLPVDPQDPELQFPDEFDAPFELELVDL